MLGDYIFEDTKMKRLFPSLIVTIIFIFPSCGQKSYEEKLNSLYRYTVPLIRSDELKENRDVIILDTRSPKEYEVSHIAGAVMIDYDRFKSRDVEAINRDAEVIVYCSVGYRSERIGEKMQKMGFRNVKNLYGGIFDWKNQGNEVVRDEAVPTDSVHTYNKAWSRWLNNGIKVYE